jgi:hypothetical protein
MNRLEFAIPVRFQPSSHPPLYGAGKLDLRSTMASSEGVYARL